VASNPWVTIVVALIAATAALTGAGIAAITAGRRQKRELDHDRTLADVSELRAVLDDAAGNVARAERAMASVALAAAGGRGVSDEAKEELVRMREDMSISAQRIRIRLGQGNAQIAYAKALDAQGSFIDLVSQGTDPGASRVDFENARNAFFLVAHSLVGSQIGRG
jgi:hypothetical protein